jgi:hypothetical protein
MFEADSTVIEINNCVNADCTVIQVEQTVIYNQQVPYSKEELLKSESDDSN